MYTHTYIYNIYLYLFLSQNSIWKLTAFEVCIYNHAGVCRFIFIFGNPSTPYWIVFRNLPNPTARVYRLGRSYFRRLPNKQFEKRALIHWFLLSPSTEWLFGNDFFSSTTLLLGISDNICTVHLMYSLCISYVCFLYVPCLSCIYAMYIQVHIPYILCTNIDYS